MPLTTAIRNTIYYGFLASCLACNQHKNNSAKPALSDTTDTSRIISRDNLLLTSIQNSNYDNWETFWKKFATAASRKDTATIIALTNFPFLQNTELSDHNEFRDLWISQPFELNKNDTAVLSSDIVLQIGEQGRERLPKFDSVYYIYKNAKEFYFAKVNGYYRFIEVITPG